jgi:hypothetical protein
LPRRLFGERLGMVVAGNQRAAERSQRVGLGFSFPTPSTMQPKSVARTAKRLVVSLKSGVGLRAKK